MKRRLESEHEVKREATGPGAGAGSGPGLGTAAAAMSDEMKHMVAALMAKELLAALAPGGGQSGARFGRVAFGDAQEATVNAFLHQKLGNDSLTRRPGPGGKRLTYIESCKAIELANRAFGFNGWSCHIIDCHEEYREKRGERWTIGFSAVVRIELKDGTSHEDVGFGTSDGQRDLGAAIEQAKKASISDARKRALRLFGEYLGNSCYDREHIKEVSSSRAVPGPPPLPSPSGVAQARAAPQPVQAQPARAQQPHPQQPQQQYPQQTQQQRLPPQQPQPHIQQQQGQIRQQPQPPAVSASRGASYAFTSAPHGLSSNAPVQSTTTSASSNSSPPLNAATVASRISAMHQQQQQQQAFQPMHPQALGGGSGGGGIGPRTAASTGAADGSTTRTVHPPHPESRPSGTSASNAAPPSLQPLHPYPSNNAPPPARMMSNSVGRSPFKLDDLTRNRSAAAAGQPTLAPGAGSAGYNVEDLSFSQFDYDPNNNENAKRMRT